MKALKKGLVGPCWLEIVRSAKVQHGTSSRHAQRNMLHIPGVGDRKRLKQVPRLLSGLGNDDAELAIRAIGEGRGRAMKEGLAQNHIDVAVPHDIELQNEMQTVDGQWHIIRQPDGD